MGPPYKRRRFNDGTPTAGDVPVSTTTTTTTTTTTRRMTRTTTAASVAATDDHGDESDHNTTTTTTSSAGGIPELSLAEPRLRRRKLAPGHEEHEHEPERQSELELEPGAADLTSTQVAGTRIDVKTEQRSDDGENDELGREAPSRVRVPVRRSGRQRKPRFETEHLASARDDEEEDQEGDADEDDDGVEEGHARDLLDAAGAKGRHQHRRRPEHDRMSLYPPEHDADDADDATTPSPEVTSVAARARTTARRSQRSTNVQQQQHPHQQHDHRKTQRARTPRPRSRQTNLPPHVDTHPTTTAFSPRPSSHAFLTLPPHLAKTLESFNQLPLPPAFPSSSAGKVSTPQLDRNADRIVLGDIAFRAWYPSFYPKDMVGIASGNGHGGGKYGAAKDGGGDNAGGKSAGGKWAGRSSGGGREKDGGQGLPPAMLETLYVCPWCFKYAKEAGPWWEHMLVCDLRDNIPGERIYAHPKRAELDGEWSVWEVDGDDNVLFCQNLSLFAKLFLDNKSVFFDVTGFNYFLLVYTPLAGVEPHGKKTTMFSAGQHIVGYFSKEKLSWDNNNLACILVFPPWQRRGLGALLMGVSYEISRRERILGGPEKPISELGRRGYKRFWAGEIARWLLTVDRGMHVSPPEDGDEDDEEEGQAEVQEEQTTEKASSRKQDIWEMESDGDVTAQEQEQAQTRWSTRGHGKRKPKAPKKALKRHVDVVDDVDVDDVDVDVDVDVEDDDKGKVLLVDVDYCSKATWIVADDCLAVLKDTGLIDEAPIRDARPEFHDAGGGTGDDDDDDVVVVLGEDDADANAGNLSKREPIRLDRQAVRDWVRTAAVELSMACDPAGFVDGYALKEEEEGDQDE